MSNSFSLDDIRAAAEAQYGQTEIKIDDNNTVVLINPLRLAKGKRDELFKLVDFDPKADDVDVDQVFEQVLRLAAETEQQGNKLIKACGGDLAILKGIFEGYLKGSQVGEA